MENYEGKTHPAMQGDGRVRIDNPISELVDDNNAGKMYIGPKRDYNLDSAQETTEPLKKKIRMAKPSKLE